MGHRLSKIYTRTGDDGTTGLADGSRVPKDNERIHAFGDVDELNCAIGLVIADAIPTSVGSVLTRIQHDLFDLGGELAIPGRHVLSRQQVSRLESELDQFNDDLPPLKDFILPGGNRAAAACHMARAICRRAERQLIALSRVEDDINPCARHYLNRLSDLLFVIARVVPRDAGRSEVLWHPHSDTSQPT